MEAITSLIEELGGEPRALVDLSKPTWSNLKYSTIVRAKKDGHQPLDIVSAVYEWQHQPIMYMVEGGNVANNGNLNKLRRILAMRGDTPYLGVVNTKQLKVYNLGLDDEPLQRTRVNLKNSKESNGAIFAELCNCRPDASVNDEKWISNVILNLLNDTIDRLIQIEDFANKDVVISLVGRALFARFLADRDLIPENLISDKQQSMSDFGDLFSNGKHAQITSNWLDKTFNGDFLPLDDSIFSELSPESWFELSNVMQKAPGNQLYLGWEQKWNKLDFAQIPVGVLSQVYEVYLSKYYPSQQREQGGYYTTSSLANYMVATSFDALIEEKSIEKIKVLDPAVGAGVFLISAFRELVMERWRKDGKQPTTPILREILNTQIKGFDINDSALKFAALGLYLMSIELDPNPVGNLKFDKLQNRVLYNLSEPNKSGSLGLGSLGKLVGKEHVGAYDLVIGNPPWTSRGRTFNWDAVESSISHIAKKRGIAEKLNFTPNKAHDLAFLWKTMDWAKPGGQISLLMNARFIFKHGKSMPIVRKTLFDKLDFQVIVNCSELRKTSILPNTVSPFCMVFAKNQIPEPDSGFYLVTPRLEKSLNDSDFMRIDSENGEYVEPLYYRTYPWAIKALSIGSQDDFGTYSRLHSMQHPTLKSMLDDISKNANLKHPFCSGVGYTIGSKGVSAFSDGFDPKLTEYKSIPFLTDEDMNHIFIESDNFDERKMQEISLPRQIDIYRGPLLLVGQSPPAGQKRFQTVVSKQDLLYKATYFGFSFRGYSYGLQLAKFLCLVLKSKITIWQALMTSGKFGIERDSIEKVELNKFLVPDFNQLSKSQLKESDDLFEKLNSGEESNFDELDDWVASIYMLGEISKQIISDTLEFRLPYASNRAFAQLSPTDKVINQFCNVLENELKYDSRFENKCIAVKKCKKLSAYPWICLSISVEEPKFRLESSIKHDIESEYYRMANNSINSPFLVYKAGPEILVGVLAQNRYWNFKEARLLALKICSLNFADLFGG